MKSSKNKDDDGDGEGKGDGDGDGAGRRARLPRKPQDLPTLGATIAVNARVADVTLVHNMKKDMQRTFQSASQAVRAPENAKVREKKKIFFSFLMHYFFFASKGLYCAVPKGVAQDLAADAAIRRAAQLQWLAVKSFNTFFSVCDEYLYAQVAAGDLESLRQFDALHRSKSKAQHAAAAANPNINYNAKADGNLINMAMLMWLGNKGGKNKLLQELRALMPKHQHNMHSYANVLTQFGNDKRALPRSNALRAVGSATRGFLRLLLPKETHGMLLDGLDGVWRSDKELKALQQWLVGLFSGQVGI